MVLGQRACYHPELTFSGKELHKAILPLVTHQEVKLTEIGPRKGTHRVALLKAACELRLARLSRLPLTARVTQLRRLLS